MSLLLALTSGVTFACSATGIGALHSGEGFKVFAPEGRTSEDYRVSGPDQSYFNPAEFELVEDHLPEALILHWRREHNSPVSLKIEPAAGGETATFSLSTERNPASALYTPISFDGTCTASNEGEA